MLVIIFIYVIVRGMYASRLDVLGRFSWKGEIRCKQR